MSKRLIINLILVAFLCGLAFVAWIKPGQQQKPSIKLTNMEPGAIHTISIERKNGDSIRFSLKNDQWKIISPIQAPALPGKVERLLKISQIPVSTHYPLEKQSLETFNLLKPDTKITFNNSTLSIGNTESVKQRRYVANSKSLFLVDDTFVHLLTVPLNQYIDTKLFSDDVQIIELKTPTLHIQRQADNTWHTTPASSKDAPSADTIQTLLDEWRFARAIAVNIEKSNHNKPNVFVTLNDGKQYTYTLTKNRTGVNLTATDSQLSYHFSADKYKRMTDITNKPDA